LGASASRALASLLSSLSVDGATQENRLQSVPRFVPLGPPVSWKDVKTWGIERGGLQKLSF
jgi:hypothetical protein